MKNIIKYVIIGIVLAVLIVSYFIYLQKNVGVG